MWKFKSAFRNIFALLISIFSISYITEGVIQSFLCSDDVKLTYTLAYSIPTLKEILVLSRNLNVLANHNEAFINFASFK